MNGGRARIDLEYDIGFDSAGKILALELHVYMLGGIVMGGSTVDVLSLAGMIDQVGACITTCLSDIDSWACICAASRL